MKISVVLHADAYNSSFLSRRRLRRYALQRLRMIAAKAKRSIDRITNAPIWLVMKVLSVTGITKAMTRAAAKAIRRERLMRASIIVMSPLLVLFMVFVILGLAGAWKAVNPWDSVIQVLRSLVLLLTALSALYFKARKVRRQHLMHVARRERSALHRGCR